MSDTIGCEIKKTNNLIRRYFENLQKLDSSEKRANSYGRVIGYLYKNRDKDIFQRDIESEFSLRRSSASSLIKRMEDDGLVTRESVDCDKRLKKIILTQRSLTECHKVEKTLEIFENTLTDGIDETEIVQFLKTLSKIQKNLQKYAYTPVNSGNEKQ